MREVQKHKATNMRSKARDVERVCGGLEAVNEQEAAWLVFSSRLLGVSLFGRGEASWCDIWNPCTSRGSQSGCTKLFGPMIMF
jgi:hypothetical protein